MSKDQSASRSDEWTAFAAWYATTDQSWPEPVRAAAWDAWRARAAVSERPFIPEGWKLVPVEATAAMTFAGLAAHPDLGATGIWQAMYDAAPSEAGAERDPNDPDPVEHARELAVALIEARKELVEIRPEAARYRWLRERPFGADFEHSSIEKGAGWALIFCMPEGSTISANLDKSLDEAMASSAER